MKTTSTLLAALQQRDNKALQFVYWDFFPSVQRHIVLHGGAGQDAEDVFQEALLILLDNIRRPGFELTSSLKTYHFAICKNIWRSKLRQQNPWVSLQGEEWEERYPDQEEEASHEAYWDSMEVVMKRITHFCSKFLTDLFLEGKLPHQYKNEHTFHNQKYKCLLQARKAAQKIKHVYG